MLLFYCISVLLSSNKDDDDIQKTRVKCLAWFSLFQNNGNIIISNAPMTEYFDGLYCIQIRQNIHSTGYVNICSEFNTAILLHKYTSTWSMVMLWISRQKAHMWNIKEWITPFHYCVLSVVMLLHRKPPRQLCCIQLWTLVFHKYRKI